MAPTVALGPELARRLGLPAEGEGATLYRTLIDMTHGRSIDVRQATRDEVAAYGMRRGLDAGHPIYALEAGSEKYLLQYDLQHLRVAFVGQMGLPNPDVAPVPVIAKRIEPSPARMTWTALFDFDSAALNAEQRARLDAELGRRLEGMELRHIKLTGYTDPIGAVEYNRKLSQQRAEALRQYLLRQGVDAGRIEVAGYGAAPPARDCPAGLSRIELIECLAPNRRVVVEVEALPR